MSSIFSSRVRFFLSLGFFLILLPSSAFALEGIGPRVTVTGTIEEVRLTDKQAFNEVGGEIIIKATNGQLVTVVLNKDSVIISEGKMSRRRQMVPSNLTVGMQIRVRGWRIDSKSLTASLFVILNIQLNPVLSANGTLQSIEGNTIKVLEQSGQVSAFTVTNETEVNVSYSLRSTDGLTLIGKQVLLTLNPLNNTQVRIITITGNK